MLINIPQFDPNTKELIIVWNNFNLFLNYQLPYSLLNTIFSQEIIEKGLSMF